MRMHVAINASFWGQETTGTGQYLHRLVSELSVNESIELCLLAARALTTEQDGPVRRLATPLDLVGVDLAKVWFEQETFVRECRRLGCDVAHVPYFAPPLRHRLPIVVTIHDLIPMLLPAYRGSRAVRLYTSLVARAAGRADLIITDSKASARDILGLLQVPERRIRVIPLAAGEQYRPLREDERAPVLERHGLSQPYILYLGGFDRRKNVPALLRAMVRARFLLEGARLVVAGRLPERDTPFTPDPRRIVRELGIEDVVQFLGHVAEEDKPALYAGALAFVFPSRYEGFGLPPLEAISCGTPAIVGQGSSLEEVVGPGGIAVPGHDIEALAEALVTLATDGRRRAQLSRAGLRHAAQFSWERAARETLQAYHDVAGR